MPGSWSIRWQAALVIVLFLGSLSTVLYSAFRTLQLPQREDEVRDRLQEAGRRMAEASQPLLEELGEERASSFDTLNRRLRTISHEVLRAYPGMEGGFYLGDGINRFGGYGFPTDRLDKATPPPEKSRGDDPPPKEYDWILLQARQSLASRNSQFNVRTVGPSRVAILTEPVGAGRAARLAAWIMFRLTNPESLADEVRAFQVSTGLALGGMALAGVLAVNLGRILQRQRLEQERLRDELRHSEHLAALGKLLAGVAHEVRNPLAGIRSTVQLWERLPDTARTPGSMEAVVRAVDRLNDIVSRLLFFVRADRTQRQPIPINEVLTETFRLLEAQAAAQGVTLDLALEEGLPAVSGSASAMRQVFLNLATNALQAMPHGGRLQCHTRSHPPNHAVEIRFIDTGPGVSPEDQGHLFEPFFTTRPDGTGLGLALCREIVVQHGGTIELEADPGPGATFRLILPAASPGQGNDARRTS